MALNKSPQPVEPSPGTPSTPAAGPVRKSVPTPSRRDAEAARRQRLNPTLSPKEAKRRQRAADLQARQRTFAAHDAQPGRQLVRDVVDSRFNLGEIAVPVLLVLMAATLFPGFVQYLDVFLYLSWGYILAMVVDGWLMWRRFKQLAAERIPGLPTKGLLMYGFNRQMSFRRWRQPQPRVKRGEAI